MHEDDRTDRLLRRHMPALDRPSPGVCLDAETMAAWHDGSLSAAARAAAEAHAADCARCLAVLAAIGRTEPDAPRPAWWSEWLGGRWLVPFTAAATAVFLWVLVEHPRAPVSVVAVPSEQAATSSEPLAPGADTTPPTPEGIYEPAPPDASRRRQEKRLERDEGVSANAARVAPPTEPSPRAEPPPSREARELARAGVEAEALTDRAAAPPQAPAGTEETQAQARELAVLEPAAPGRGDAAAEPRTAIGEMFAAPFEIVSPDAAVRWRVAGSAVQRSTDGGSTWVPQTTAGVPLVAGSAPAPAVCWVVGRSGTVLVSTDGQTWSHRRLPHTADLVAVTAADAFRATVTTSDARTYRTADGGRTWTLQENPAAPF